MHDFENARMLFIDGPVQLRVCEAPKEEILDAFERLRRYILPAAEQLGQAHKERNDG